MEKLYTFHNYADRWYVCIQRDWVDTVSVTRGADVAGVQGYVFSAGRDQKHQVLFTIYAFTGDKREELAASERCFPLETATKCTLRLPGWWRCGAANWTKAS